MRRFGRGQWSDQFFVTHDAFDDGLGHLFAAGDTVDPAGVRGIGHEAPFDENGGHFGETQHQEAGPADASIFGTWKAAEQGPLYLVGEKNVLGVKIVAGPGPERTDVGADIGGPRAFGGHGIDLHAVGVRAGVRGGVVVEADEKVGSGAFGDRGAFGVVDVGIVASGEDHGEPLLNQACADLHGERQRVGFFEASAQFLAGFLSAVACIEADGADGAVGGEFARVGEGIENPAEILFRDKDLAFGKQDRVRQPESDVVEFDAATVNAKGDPGVGVGQKHLAGGGGAKGFETTESGPVGDANVATVLEPNGLQRRRIGWKAEKEQGGEGKNVASRKLQSP